MCKRYILEYRKEGDFSALVVADAETKLDNGNYKVLNILIGDFADEVLAALIKEEATSESE